jgi:Tol biopolymer transport system component
MTRGLVIGIVAATLGAGVMLHAQPARNTEVQMKAAQQKAEVEGDLKGAIEAYKKVVASAGTSRALAAQALIRMAECYQKLGDAEARRIYERVIREYGDQKELVALAQTRVGVTDTTSITSRRVTTVRVGGVGYGTVSPDGKYFPYTNWENGDLYLRDLVTGTDRRLTNSSGLLSRPSQFAVQAAFSKDGKQLAYGWLNDTVSELRIVDTTGADIPQARRVFHNDDVKGIWPDDWSGDGKWLAVQIRREDKTAQIGLVGVQDGSLRVLKSVDWRGASRLMFSPDGKYLAYDLPVSDTENQRDVFILAVDGSREVVAVVHPADDLMMGWSTDGSHLLFASDRSGAMGLWQLPVRDGRPDGTTDLIKPNVEGAPLGVTSHGALYSLVHHPRFNSALNSDIQVATFDFETGRFLSRPVSPVQSFVGANSNPVWSPDGKSLAYVSRREEPTSMGATVIAIRSVAGGQTRELRPILNLYPPIVRWSADGRSLLTQGKDTKGRQGLFRIDAQSGAVSVIAFSRDEGEIRLPAESPDGAQLYYVHGGTQRDREFAVLGRHVVTGNESELARDEQSDKSVDVIRGPNIFAPTLSPDGQWIVVRREGPERGEAQAGQSSALLLVSTRGGQSREIIRVDLPRSVSVHSWTPDSLAILAAVVSPDGAEELWRVPLDGGERRKLDTNIHGMTPFSLHPDGRQIAYALTERAKDDEIWVLENFLPMPHPRK